MTTSLVCTVLNEEKTISQFLYSATTQTKSPDEIIIVDGGSIDKTIECVKDFIKSHKKLNIQVVTVPGNRSKGRNHGIKKAKGSIILLSDSGCILSKTWVNEISKPFQYPSVTVVAGYYKGKASSVFQKCLIPYVLVMPDRIDKNEFLPSTRSMAIHKSVWEKVGRFPEEYSHNEDYLFARMLKRQSIKIFFAKKAIVFWMPRKTFMDAFIMFYRFALGDGEAGVFRIKAILTIFRYVLFVLLLYFFVTNGPFYLLAIIFLVFCYVVWSIQKNYRYVSLIQAFVLLPMIQITADLAVFAGSTMGYLSYFAKKIN